jgi:hypothetical protein
VHIGPKGASYVQVLPKGYSKSSVRSVVPCTSGALFAERTFDGPPLYVRTTDRSVCPLDQAYVHPPVGQCPASIPRGSKRDQVKAKGLCALQNTFIENFG